MKTVLSVLVAVSIAFLIDYLWRKRKQASSTEDQATEIGGNSNTQTETSVRRSKHGTAKRIGKFALLYFAVVFATSILSGALGGLAQTFAAEGYTIVKLSVPVVVFIVFLYFLARKYSLLQSAKLLTYVYAIVVILRVVFHENSGTGIGEAFFHSIFPYAILLVASGAIFLVKRSKTRALSVQVEQSDKVSSHRHDIS